MASPSEISLVSRPLGPGKWQVTLSVPSMRCGGCLQKIETALAALEGVDRARANLTMKRVEIDWHGQNAPRLIETLAAHGYDAHLHETDVNTTDKTLSHLIRALAVAGFATGNIMLLSVSVWSGAEGGSQNLFHWISALIAVPTLAYSGQSFFTSAWRALRSGHTNMDVPISIGVLLTFGMSLYDTINGGEQVYFDATVMLLFFLLIGRTLDHAMRERARNAVAGLARLIPRSATVEYPDGSHASIPVDAIDPGMSVVLTAGERAPVDGKVLHGASEVDCSIVTGESLPRLANPGTEVKAGTLNLTGPLVLRANAAASQSFLSEVIGLMETAGAGRSRFRRIADRAARLYAPVVHLAALLAFLGWMAAQGDAHRALTIAVAVLIITCPCALGLAVPMVQTVAARRLFQDGVLVREGAAMERLAAIDTVIFDKTGTLTSGQPRLRNRDTVDPEHLALAATMAAHSAHPFSQALVAGYGEATGAVEDVSETPGFGLTMLAGPDSYRLGRTDWASRGDEANRHTAASTTVLSKNGQRLETFEFDDPVRAGGGEAVAALLKRGLHVELLSGDDPAPVARLAAELGIAHFTSAATPAEKQARLVELEAAGRKVLMVGDGLNDAPALAAAFVSMAPSSAADVGRSAADFILLRDDLESIPRTIILMQRADRLIRQNFALAVGYNAIAIPFAVAGYVSPLVAALSMSASSILVAVNALRLDQRGKARRLGTSLQRTGPAKQSAA